MHSGRGAWDGDGFRCHFYFGSDNNSLYMPSCFHISLIVIDRLELRINKSNFHEKGLSFLGFVSRHRLAQYHKNKGLRAPAPLLHRSLLSPWHLHLVPSSFLNTSQPCFDAISIPPQPTISHCHCWGGCIQHPCPHHWWVVCVDRLHVSSTAECIISGWYVFSMGCTLSGLNYVLSKVPINPLQ